MAFGAIAETTVALIWNASTDNVGVAGYRLYRNDVAVGTVTSPGYTYSGLTCGTSYTFALEAYDAAGNASNRAFATGTTSTSRLQCPAAATTSAAVASGFWGCECVGGCGWWVVCEEGDACWVCER